MKLNNIVYLCGILSTLNLNNAYPAEVQCIDSLRIPIIMKKKTSSVTDYYAKAIWDEEVEPIWGDGLGTYNQYHQFISMNGDVYFRLDEISRDTNLGSHEINRFHDAQDKRAYLIDKMVWNHAKNKGIIKNGIVKELSFEPNMSGEVIEYKYNKAMAFAEDIKNGKRQKELGNMKQFLYAWSEIYLSVIDYFYNSSEVKESNVNPLSDSVNFYFYALDSTDFIDQILKLRDKVKEIKRQGESSI